jgi:hypothetical protein
MMFIAEHIKRQPHQAMSQLIAWQIFGHMISSQQAVLDTTSANMPNKP